MESLGAILRRIAAPGTLRATNGGTDDYRGNPQRQPEELAAERCLICAGAGWVTPSVSVEHPDFGKAFPCQCQESGADREVRTAALERYSNLGSLRQVTFDNINPDGPGRDVANRQAFAGARQAAVAYAAEPDGWLTFVGPSGSGKTWLAAAIANRRIELGRVALFITAADLLDYLRGGFDDDAEMGFIDLFEHVRQAELLILDDLPTRPASPWGQERLLQLLARRHSERLPTVITLRGDPNRLDDFLRTRFESPDGFGRIYRLGRVGGVAGRIVGAIRSGMRQRMTFDSFDIDGNGGLTDREKLTLEAAKIYMQTWANQPLKWVYLNGPYGVGKTHLAVAAVVERENRGDDVFFATVADLLDHLRATFAPDSPITHEDLLDRIRTADVLVLDDMGAERNTPFAEDKLFQIINYRYEEQSPTIITTSQSIEDIAIARPRIASRLQDRQVVTEWPIEAPDYRLGGARR
jgi:DNA replication protein DnaC